MNYWKKIFSALCSVFMMLSLWTPVYADENEAVDVPAGQQAEIDGTYYYRSLNGDYLFEKVSHPSMGAGEVDGFLDETDSRSQSYAWSAIEYGDYIYFGTCYNSTYGIYWRAVFNMMLGMGKTSQEAMQIARDFVQFVFDEKFDETLSPKGVIVKLNKNTGEFSLVFDSKKMEENAAIRATNCSGYRMAFEFHGKLYFVSLASPTMFLLEIDPEDGGAAETCRIAYSRSLSADGRAAKIAAGVHGLVVYDDEILMCLAGEADEDNGIPEGGMIVASSDGENWRVIADENDLGPSAYHEYDGLMGGGIWDIIEYNGHVYVTVVTDLTDIETGIVNKQGFALYRGTKQEDGSFIWEMMAGDTSVEGVELPYGFGTTYSMACNMWVYDGYLYLGTYNDPMLDFTAVAERGDFSDLYYDLYYSINLYRMDENENIELVAGRPNDCFTEAIGNMGPGFGDCSNQYVWRMAEHEDKLWIGTYDASVLASAFTQLTDGQLLDMSEEQYMKRLVELENMAKSFGILKEEYGRLFELIFGSDTVQYLFNGIQKLIDAGTGNNDPVPAYLEVMEQYEAIKACITGKQGIIRVMPNTYKKMMDELNRIFFTPMDQMLTQIGSVVYYFGTNYYMKNATKGFDLFVSEDGINFETITDNGFGDENNHGVRTLTSADEGTVLYAGTANPYFGGQMWRQADSIKEPEPEIPAAVTTDEITAMNIPVSVVCDTDPEHILNGVLNGEDVKAGEMKETEGLWTITLHVNPDSYVKTFNEQYGLHAYDGKEINITLYLSEEGWKCDEAAVIPVSEEKKQAYTVALETGKGGTVEQYMITVNEDDQLSEKLPAVTAYYGFVFRGWSADGYTVLSDEELDTLNPAEIRTLYAVYDETVDVKFITDGNGTLTGETELTLVKGSVLETIPEVSAYEGYHFKGWTVNGDTAEDISALTAEENLIIRAVFEKDTVNVPEIETEKVTVIFTTDTTGSLIGENTYQINKGTSLTTVPAVTAAEGYEFAGWKYGNEIISSDDVKSLIIREDTEFTAAYKAVITEKPAEDTRPETPVTGDQNTGSYSGQTETKPAVDTSDSTDLMLYGGIGIGAVVLLAVVLILRRKNS